MKYNKVGSDDAFASNGGLCAPLQTLISELQSRASFSGPLPLPLPPTLSSDTTFTFDPLGGLDMIWQNPGMGRAFDLSSFDVQRSTHKPRRNYAYAHSSPVTHV